MIGDIFGRGRGKTQPQPDNTFTVVRRGDIVHLYDGTRMIASMTIGEWSYALGHVRDFGPNVGLGAWPHPTAKVGE